jgi:hypothetical protein
MRYMKRINKLAIVLTLVSVLFFFTADKGVIAVKMQGYKALKVFAQVQSSELTPEFNIYETENFIIKYTDEDEDIIEDIAGIFEKSYDTAGDSYEYYPEEKTMVFVYHNQQDMWAYQKAVNGQAVMGLYHMGIIHVLSPKAYLDKEQVEQKLFEADGPVLHEYVHKVIDDRTGGNVELWLTEGLALYEEYAMYGTEWAQGFIYESYYTGEELRKDFMELDETQSYKQSYDIVRGLIEQYGRESINSLLDELKKGNTLDEAFINTFDMELKEYMDSDAWKA